MGYNHNRYARRVGTVLIVKDPTLNYPAVKMYDAGYISINLGATGYFLFKEGGTQIGRMEYTPNVTTFEGGGVTGDDLKFKCNTIDADSFITLEGLGDIVLAPTAGSYLKFGTHTATGDAVSNGSIAIKDAGGTVRKLMTKA